MDAMHMSAMNVVDSNGWIRLIEDAPHADYFEELISDTEHLIVPVTVFYEVFKYIKLNRSDHDACQAGFQMLKGRLIHTTHVLAFQAADLSLAHKLPMADALILATARAYYATLHTLDSHFDGLEGVRYLAG